MNITGNTCCLSISQPVGNKQDLPVIIQGMRKTNKKGKQSMEDDLSTLGGRIRFARKRAKLSQAKLAAMVGISQQSVFEIEKGETQHTYYIEQFAKALNLPKEWLEFGTSQQELIEATYGDKDKIQFKRLVPVLSQEQAFQWCGAPSKIDVKKIDNFIAIADGSKDSFGLKVRGDTMVAPFGVFPSFPEGMTIIIDPALKYEHGKFVVALLKGAKELTFKQYIEDANRKFLKPLNPQYPSYEITNEDDVKICGVVIAYQGILA